MFKKKKLTEYTDGELHKEYAKLAKDYEKKPTRQTADKMNEIVGIWKNRERKSEKLPDDKKYEPVNKVEIPNEIPVEVQQAMHDLDPNIKDARQVKTTIDDVVEIIPSDFLKAKSELNKALAETIVERGKEKSKLANPDKLEHQPQETGKELDHNQYLLEKENEFAQKSKKEKEVADLDKKIMVELSKKTSPRKFKLFKRKLAEIDDKLDPIIPDTIHTPKRKLLFFRKKVFVEKLYCIKCKHETIHHVRKNGVSEGCKLCGCLKTIDDIKNQEETGTCEQCEKEVFVIEAVVYQEKPYHHKCYDEMMWEKAGENNGPKND